MFSGFHGSSWFFQLLLLTTMGLCGLGTRDLLADDETPLPRLMGQITCPDAAKFEPKTVAKIVLADVSIADADAKVIAEIELSKLTTFPISFELPYDPKKIQPGLMYAIQVRIETEGRLDYINDTRISPFENGKPVEKLEVPVISIRR